MGTRLIDTLLMSAWGVIVAAPAAAALALHDSSAWPMLVAGGAFGPIYALCWRLSDGERLPRLGAWVRGATEWAELGAGAAIVLAILAG